MKTFIVEEAKLAAFVDLALKAGGLALHSAAQSLLTSLVEHTAVATPAIAPTEVLPQ